MFIYAVSDVTVTRELTLKSHAGCHPLYSRCINRSVFFSPTFFSMTEMSMLHRSKRLGF